MPIVNGVWVPLDFATALKQVIDSAPSTIKFAPGNPPELVFANLLAEARRQVDDAIGDVIAAELAPVGAAIDLQNPNDPRREAEFTSGYLVCRNYTDQPIPVPANTTVTASTGQTYVTGGTVTNVPAAADEYTPGTAEITVTATESGAGGNIPSGQLFSGVANLTITNPLPMLNGAPAENDARYLTRTIKIKTEYGSQQNSVAAETELKKFYTAAHIYVNRTQAALVLPVPVPGNGYNMCVRTPSGGNASAFEAAKIFEVLAKRFELVNSQNAGDARHAVISGTIYTSAVPQSYSYTAAQAVDTTISATILVRFASNTANAEKISQSVGFATYFIDRVCGFLSGIDGTAQVNVELDEYTTENRNVKISANTGDVDPIAPTFDIATIRDLISDASTRANTPLLYYSGCDALVMLLDPQVEYEPAVMMSLDPSDRQFINFASDALFSDGSSWFDRFCFVNPAQVTVTVKVIN